MQCRGEPFGIEVDCWALGVVLFTLLGAYMPFDPHSNANDATVRARIVRGVPAFTEGEGGYPQQWRHVSTAAQDIIRRLLEVDASKRLTAAEALGQPWVCGDDAHCPSTPIPDSDEQLRRFNDARRVWRLAADAVALVVRAPLTTAAVGASVAAAAAGGASGSATAECLPATSAKGGGGSGGGEAPPAAGGAGTITLPDEARRELKAAFDQFDEDKVRLPGHSDRLRATRPSVPLPRLSRTIKDAPRAPHSPPCYPTPWRHHTHTHTHTHTRYVTHELLVAPNRPECMHAERRDRARGAQGRMPCVGRQGVRGRGDAVRPRY